MSLRLSIVDDDGGIYTTLTRNPEGQWVDEEGDVALDERLATLLLGGQLKMLFESARTWDRGNRPANEIDALVNKARRQLQPRDRRRGLRP